MSKSVSNVRNWGIMFFMLGAATAIGYLFRRLEFTEANIVTVYILGVLLAALFTKNYICSVVCSLCSVLLFNFFFTEPRFTLLAYESGYPVTFVIMLIVSLIIGTLANKVAVNARESAATAYRTKVLLETNQLLQKADDEAGALGVLAGQLNKLLSRNIVVYPIVSNIDSKTDEYLGTPQIFPLTVGDECKAMVTPQEQVIARWVLKNKQNGGADTKYMPDALCLHLPIKANDIMFGIVGIQVGVKAIDPFDNSMLMAILGECALAIENIRNAKAKEQNALLAKNEQLRANLLRAISHDLRTPLTSISGNVENLLSNYIELKEETRKEILAEVYEDSQWLINLVENILSISRISEGRMTLNKSLQVVDEVLGEVMHHLQRKVEGHKLLLDIEKDELMFAEMDANLIGQVIVNLVDNAVKYTPLGSEIVIGARKEGSKIYISVTDNGAGIPDAMKPKVFQMFFTGEHNVVDARRSLGLGLALCKSIIDAHGGEMILSDNEPHGCCFTFTLDVREVNFDE